MDAVLSGLPPYAQVTSEAELPCALSALGVPTDRPVLVCVGGAAGMDDADRARVEELIREQLAPVLQRRGAVVIDGGTDAGIMAILGRARSDRYLLLGVAAIGTVRLPGQVPSSPQAAALEPNHSAVLLVPGSDWGDESVWIARVAGYVAGRAPSATLVLNGGEITTGDIERSLEARRPVLVVDGTGRTADAIAQAATSRDGGERLRRLASSPLLTVVHRELAGDLARAVDLALQGDSAP